MADKKTNHLTVYLIKTQYAAADQILKTASCRQPVEVPIEGSGVAHLFVKKTQDSPPRWAHLFQDFIDLHTLAVPGVAAVFLLKIRERMFALAFGQGGRFLLHDDVHEERFGLLCALNSVDPKTFRCVDVQSLDAIQSHKRVQSGQEATPDQFGLDVEQDMLKAIVGAPLNPGFGSRMTGSDALSVSVKMDLADLPALLAEYGKQFEEDLNANDHEWVHNIALVKSSSLIGELESALDAKLFSNDLTGVWLSIPEIIDWSTVRGFMYTGGRREVHPDINMKGFLKTLESASVLSLELLRKRKVSCADDDNREVFKSWPVIKCLYAEVDHDGNKFILNDGKWFCVGADFVDRTNRDYRSIPMSSLVLPHYKGGGEGAYNASVAAEQPQIFALLDDRKKVMHGGGHGQVEICDLLSVDRHLIHVKMYGKSSVFSHLFAQGFVSGQLIQIDSDFRQKVVSQLAEPFTDLIEVDRRPRQDEFTVVFAVISEEEGAGLSLPFFSRVNLNNTAKVLKGFGYKVELLKIPYDLRYAKTTKLPPREKGPKPRREKRPQQSR